jgi:Icc-related predicted phosphoesterase
MTILAIADQAPSRSLLEILAEQPVDLIVTLGDLTYFSLKELSEVKNIPKIGVYGNHCSGRYFDSLGIINLHLKTFTHQGLVFGGFEGSFRYKNTDAKMYTQAEAQTRLKDFPAVDVMIAHSPPFGINDEPDSPSHQGLLALKEYIEEKKPKYFMHGHTYPAKENLVSKYQDTNIIYVYGEKIITI